MTAKKARKLSTAGLVGIFLTGILGSLSGSGAAVISNLDEERPPPIDCVATAAAMLDLVDEYDDEGRAMLAVLIDEDVERECGAIRRSAIEDD